MSPFQRGVIEGAAVGTLAALALLAFFLPRLLR
jgi:hypothetical protein